MKNLVRYILISGLLIVASKSAILAQSRSITMVNYNPSVTLGDVTNFIDEFSFRGVNVDSRYFIDPNITVGFKAGWNVYRQESDGIASEVITQGNNVLTISAKQYKYINMYPILLSGHYHFGVRGAPRPYIGLGAGAYHVTRRVEMGLFSSQTDKLHFGVAPMVGVILPTNSRSWVHFGVQYNQVLKSGEYDGMSNLSLDLGVGFGF